MMESHGLAAALALGALCSLAAAASAAGAQAVAPQVVAAQAAASGRAASASAAAGCLPNGAGYLRARIRGAVNLDIDWHNAQLECEGGSRPSGGGIVVSFAGPLPRSDKRIRIIFGIGGAAEGHEGRALPTNVTVIFEGERHLFSSRGDDKCTVDNLRQEPLGPPSGTVRRYRVVARGFCFEPMSDMMSNERIVISRFDFSGRTAFP